MVDDTDRMDLAPEQRRHLPRILLISTVLLLITSLGTGVLAWRTNMADPDGRLSSVLMIATIVLGIFAAGASIVMAIVLVWLPRFLTRQGIETDSTGLVLYQDAKWWFKGRNLHIPWSSLTDVTPPTSAARGSGSALVLHVDNLRLGARAPHWALLTHAGSQTETSRLYLQLPKSGDDTVTRMVNASRRALRGEDKAHDLGAVEGVEEEVSLRGTRVVFWSLLFAVCFATPLIMLVSYLFIPGSQWGDPVPLVLTGLLAAVTLFCVLIAPRYWAPQSVAANADGIVIRRESLLWAGRRHFYVPWNEVQGIDAHSRSRQGRPRGTFPVVELYLTHVDPGVQLPGWADLVRPGVSARGRVANRPRLVLTTSDEEVQSRVELLLRRARPHLFETSHEPDSIAESSHANATAPNGPKPSAPEPTATQWAHPDVRVDQWIAVPRRGFTRIILVGAPLLVFLITSLPALNATIVAPDAFAGSYPLTVVLCLAGLVWLLGWQLPQACARVGARVTPEGLELVREAFLWCREQRTTLLWRHVHEVRPSRALSLSSLTDGWPVADAVDVLVDPGHTPRRTPHWVRVRTGHNTEMVRVRLMTDSAARKILLAAIATVRR